MSNKRSKLRMAKIVATVGPASESPAILGGLLKAGVDVFRLNMSHGSREGHRRLIGRIRTQARRQGRLVGLLLDLPGPKIRIGELFEGGPLRLAKGSRLCLTTRRVTGRDGLISTTYRGLSGDVHAGSRVLLDDGNLELRVLRVDGPDIYCRVVVGGWLSEHKGINLPGTSIAASSPTPRDLRELGFALDEHIDWVALSFVKKPRDLWRVRRALKRKGGNLPLIAKIERREGVTSLDEILDTAEGLMVARGDLAVEVSPQKVPILQKRMIRRANETGAAVITATQMLESMIESPRPTRAEASDVANAVLDGSDAVMLSGETASGNYPIESVVMMDSIIREAEGSALDSWSAVSLATPASRNERLAVVKAAVEAARESEAAAVAVFTQTGETARLLSKLRPPCPILGLTFHEAAARRMTLFWGVSPLVIKFAADTDRMLALGEREMVRRKLVRRGDRVVVVAGTTPHPGGTNMMKILRVGE